MSDISTISASAHCLHCGKPIEQPLNGVAKRFCSSKCRMAHHARARARADAILHSVRDLIAAIEMLPTSCHNLKVTRAIQAIKELMSP